MNARLAACSLDRLEAMAPGEGAAKGRVSALRRMGVLQALPCLGVEPSLLLPAFAPQQARTC